MRIALNEDHHVHSTVSDGRTTLLENIAAAETIGLRRLGCVEHVRADSHWVGDYLDHVRILQRATQVQLIVGVETRINDEHGRLCLPSDLPPVDRIYIADHRLPIGDHALTLGEARAGLEDGSLTPERVIDALMISTERALERHPGAVIAHLCSFLPKVGLSEFQIGHAAIHRLAHVARQTGAILEVDERWACPSVSVVGVFIGAGVPVVASSDAHHARDIGFYTYVSQLAQALEPKVDGWGPCSSY
ncbi:MAG: putative hydrolase [Cognaticolwellia sp.]|jgi:putative hydrolase